MLKSVLVLPDGKQISSGVGTKIAIRHLTVTESVNRGEELTLGSACAAMLEAELFTPDGCLSLTAGDKVTLYYENEKGYKIKKGVFRLERPSRPSANILRLVGYDRMVMLDRDMTDWLDSLTDWPYTLSEFADMVCSACGLRLVQDKALNGDFPVQKFSAPEMTGRRILQWLSEIAGCFCRVDLDGTLHFDWYQNTNLTAEATGIYEKSLAYETYQVKPVDRVQLKLADGNRYLCWPEAEEGENCYVIQANPILMTEVSDNLRVYLQALENRLKQLTYTPCRVAIPANSKIDVGSLITVQDRNGQRFTTCVMTKISTARKTVLESTGSPTRDSATASNNQDELSRFRLAVYSLDGKRIASLINMSPHGIRIESDKIRLEGVVTANGRFKILEDGSMRATAGKIAGWNMDENSLYSGTSFNKADCFLCTGSESSLSIAGSEKQPGWVLKAGENFGVLQDGTLYAQNANITGGTIVIPRSEKWEEDDFMRLCNLERLSFGFGTTGLCVSNLNMEKRAGYGFYILNDMMSFQWSGGGIPFLSVNLLEAAQPVFHLNGTWMLNAAPIITSDENAKQNIQPQAEVYSQVFDRLKPVTFRYKDGHSDRTHTGLIAQDVEKAVRDCGLDTQAFAALCKEEQGSYGIRYEELVSMLIYEVQKLKKQVARLEKTNTREEENESNQ